MNILGKIIVQKWAEQRYGVFPEYYQTPDQSDYPSYCQYNFPFDPFLCVESADKTKPSSCSAFETGKFESGV